MAEYIISELGRMDYSPCPIRSNPPASVTTIKSVLLHNTTSATVTVELHLVSGITDATGVPMAGTADKANCFWKRILAPDETFELVFTFPLYMARTYDELIGTVSALDAVTFIVFGIVEN